MLVDGTGKRLPTPEVFDKLTRAEWRGSERTRAVIRADLARRGHVHTDWHGPWTEGEQAARDLAARTWSGTEPPAA